MRRSGHKGGQFQSEAPSPHWEQMLQELLEDRDKGRVEGPLQAAASWNMTFVAVNGDGTITVPDYTGLCSSVLCCGATWKSPKMRGLQTELSQLHHGGSR